MKDKHLNIILDNCPRMVAVFMVNHDGAEEDVRDGDIVYWNWERDTYSSHYRDVEILSNHLEFIGYAPTLDMDGHTWPNMCELRYRERTGEEQQC